VVSLQPAYTTLDAYDRWAPSYAPVAHNPLMRAEQEAMLELWPPTAGRRALDLACGTGRYAKLLSESQAAMVTALDFSTAMLRRVSGSLRVRGSMTSLPFVRAAFDVVVSGLALGHAASLRHWMSEVARVSCSGGTLLYSDFHPEAARAGLTRSFKDERERTYTLEHSIFDVHEQLAAAGAAGLAVECVRELRVGVEVSEPFAGSADFYRRWHGLPLVLIVRALKR